MTENIIRGYGGGGNKPKKPKITPDNLNSRQHIRILDLLSEGEIEGFASPSKEGLTQGTTAYDNAALKDVFLNNTPVLESSASSSSPSDSDFNFADVGFDVRFGTSSQAKVKGVKATGSPINVGVTVTKSLANGVTRQITDSTIDQVRITLDFPVLQKITSKGDQLGSKVELKIQVQYNSGGFTTLKTDTVKGRTTDLYQRSYLIDLTGSFPVDIRVTRETDDSTDAAEQNAFSWNSYVELKDDNLTYLNSAYTSLKLDSKQFSSIPSRKFRIRGIKVRIPAAGSSTQSGTYSQTGNRVTVQSTSHGFVTGDSISFTPNAGATPAGTYTVLAGHSADDLQFDVSPSQTVAGSPTCTIGGLPSVDTNTGRIIYPSNYIFNGTMGAAVWTTCPAMILLDLMTNKRYGFGTHIAPDQSTDAKLYENIDLFSYFNASKFANELVSDGTTSGEEARFSCNVNIQSSTEAFTLINELAGVMRCMPIWSAGSISLTQDKPKDPSYLFNLSNVTEAGFSYSGSDLKTRSTIINVSYLNMETREIDYETVGDNVTGTNPNQDDIDRQAKYGIVVKNIKAFATTSASQARRLAKAVLFSQERESETVTFSTSIDSGTVCRPGSVIEIADPVRSGVRRGGKVKTATTSQITIDDINSVNLQTSTLGTNPKLSVVLPDGTMETKTVSTLAGAVFTVNGTFSQTPNANTVWLFQNDDVQSQLFRVINVAETDGIVYGVTALSYVSNKYDAIEQSDPIDTRTITTFNNPVSPPTNLKAVEKIVAINGKAVSKIIITWQAGSGVNEYQVNYRLDNNNFTSVRVLSNDFEIFNSSAGTYEIEVFAYNTLGEISSTATSLNFIAEGKTAPPSDITGLSLEPINDKDVRLRWDLHPDVDVIHGGQIYVRHNLLADGTGSFQNSTNLIPALAGNSTLAVVPAIEGEYILKARDDTGNFSSGETSVVLDIPEEIKPLAILTRREDLDSPIFQGSTSDTVEVRSDTQSIDLRSTGLFDDITDFDALAPSLDDFGSISPEGFYDFGGTAGGTVLDLGAVYNLELKRHIFAEGFIPNNLFDFITDVDVMTDFDGVQAFNSAADLLVKTSGNPSTYSPSGTYSQSGGTEITIDISNHNFKVGNFVDCDFTSGTATDGEFEITSIVSANQFKIKVTNAVSTSGNVTCGPDFTAFQSFANGRFKGQSFKFRVKLTSGNVNQDIKVTQLGYTASFPRRTEQSTSNIASGAGAKAITFDNEFFTGTSALGGVNSSLPSIGITAQNLASGDFFEITNITGAGFTVTFKNSSGSAVDRNFSFTAVGFGKKG